MIHDKNCFRNVEGAGVKDAPGGEIIASGVTGDCTWTLTGTPGDYTLVIGGSGSMRYYDSEGESEPWFEWRDGIKTVIVRDGVTMISRGSFSHDGLISIRVDAANPRYSSGDGVLFNKDKTTLVRYPRGKVGDYIIPASVIAIDGHAFSECPGLTSVVIPASLITLVHYDFRESPGLTAIHVEATNPRYSSVDGVLFNKNKTALLCYPAGRAGDYAIPGTVTTIDSEAFAGCRDLTSVIIPALVTTINIDIFGKCCGLTAIHVEAANEQYSSVDGVLFDKDKTTLVRYPEGRTGSYVIPASVVMIYHDTFSECRGLTAIHVEAGNECYSSADGVLFDKDKATLLCYPVGRTGGYVIPDSVDMINAHAFRDCNGLTTVIIPDSLTAIDSGAFSGCQGLMNVTIGRSVTAIDRDVFYDCPGLITVTIPASITTISCGAFDKCSNLTAIHVDAANTRYSSVDGVLFNKEQTKLLYCPAGRTGDYAIPRPVTTIGGQAFNECHGLATVTLPASVTAIYSDAFDECRGLTAIHVEAANERYSSVDGVLFNKGKTALLRYPVGRTGDYIIPATVTTLGKWAFRHCHGLTSVAIPNSVTAIGYEVFNRCGLTAVTIPHSVTLIGRGAFMECFGLASVTIPDSVTRIGKCAFNLCFSLTSATIPASVTAIGDGAFGYCLGLTAVTIPASLTALGCGFVSLCLGLTAIHVEAANEQYSSVDGVLFNKDKTTLLRYPAGRTGDYAIPASVTAIGDHAFGDCRLTSVTIPDSVTAIGDHAFNYCMSLTSAILPGSVTTIGNWVFMGCDNLATASIPASVTAIGHFAFCSCESLATVISLNPAPLEISDRTFQGDMSACTLKVPAASVEAYKAAPAWNEFENIVAIDDEVNDIIAR